MINSGYIQMFMLTLHDFFKLAVHALEPGKYHKATEENTVNGEL